MTLKLLLCQINDFTHFCSQKTLINNLFCLSNSSVYFICIGNCIPIKSSLSPYGTYFETLCWFLIAGYNADKTAYCNDFLSMFSTLITIAFFALTLIGKIIKLQPFSGWYMYLATFSCSSITLSSVKKILPFLWYSKNEVMIYLLSCRLLSGS